MANIVDMKTVMANEVDGDMGNAWLKANSAGTGAYVLRSFKPNEGYVLEARAGHWRGDAPIKNVFMQHVPEGATQRLLLEKGDIDIGREMTPTDIDGFAGNADIKVQNDVGGQVYYLALNQKKAELANPKVQEAMRWAVDYTGMTDSILKGQWVVHQAFLPQGFLGALTETPYSLDVEKAKALMAESGVTLPLEVKLHRPQQPGTAGHRHLAAEHLRAGRDQPDAGRGRRRDRSGDLPRPSCTRSRCRPGGRTIPTRTPTPRPSR